MYLERVSSKMGEAKNGSKEGITNQGERKRDKFVENEWRRQNMLPIRENGVVSKYHYYASEFLAWFDQSADAIQKNVLIGRKKKI